MPVLVPFASGKGGVGKTVSVVNLAILLARRGKTTILADMDWGGSNTHTVLGIKNSRIGLGSWISDGGMEVADLVQPLEQPHLFFIPGDGLIPGTANMPFHRKKRLMKELKSLQADYVLMDLGAGTSYNTVDLFLASESGFVVTTPEPTAILNAYSFIKTCLFRLLQQAVPAKSPVRQDLVDFFKAGMEFGNQEDAPNSATEAVLRQLAAGEEALGAKLLKVWQSFLPGILINMGKDVDELRLGAKLRQICRKHLGTEVEYLGFMPWEESVRQSVMRRTPLALGESGPRFITALDRLAAHLCTNSPRKAPSDMADQKDLEDLGEAFLELQGID